MTERLMTDTHGRVRAMFSVEQIKELMDNHGANYVAEYLSKQFIAQKERIEQLEVEVRDWKSHYNELKMENKYLDYQLSFAKECE